MSAPYTLILLRHGADKRTDAILDCGLTLPEERADQRTVGDRTIDSHIKKLRKKLAAAAPDEELIHSVYGVGYKFES